MACCFFRLTLGDEKNVASSLQVLETQWSSLRLKPALCTFYSKNKVKKLLKQSDFKTALKVSQFLSLSFVHIFQPSCRTFAVFKKIRSCSGVLLLTLSSSFVCVIRLGKIETLGNQN